jgi:hypothetical protein
MTLIDAWTLITGMASVLSLLLTLPEKHANWRPHLVKLSIGLAGFAVGRLSFSVTGADQLLSDPSGLRALVLILAMLVAGGSVAFLLIRRGESSFAYSIMLFSILLVSSQVALVYRQPSDVVSVDDYILLSTAKVQSHQFDTALKYLAAARRITAIEPMRVAIDKQIETVAAEAAKAKNP